MPSAEETVIIHNQLLLTHSKKSIMDVCIGEHIDHAYTVKDALISTQNSKEPEHICQKIGGTGLENILKPLSARAFDKEKFTIQNKNLLKKISKKAIDYEFNSLRTFFTEEAWNIIVKQINVLKLK